MLQKPIRICTSQEMRDIDLAAEKDFGIDANILMENAGRAATQVLLEQYPKAGTDTEILIFAGKGNNAGDAFVVARRLICLGRRVRVFHLESKYKNAALKNFEILKKLKAKMFYLEQATDLESFFQSSPGPFTAVDGILGTGLKGHLDGIFYDIVEMINAQNISEVIALDIPTGVSGDTGQVHSSAIQADLTISFGFPKLGHFLPPGAVKRGKLVNVDISLPPVFSKSGDKFLLTKGQVSSLIQERDKYGHKNSFGHVLLIGGSEGRLGAIAMAAHACLKMGTGLVTVGTWAQDAHALSAKLPNEIMTVPITLGESEIDQYRKMFPSYSCVVVGPGLGMNPDGAKIIKELLVNYHGGVVLDADALNLVSEHKLQDYIIKRRAPTVLTPHPGEMARLLATPKETAVLDPVSVVRNAVKQTHATVLLKGAATVVGGTDEKFYLNHYPNDGMATAGSGDVLAGMIGGLLGQGMKPFDATTLGVYLHSLAGDFAARDFGHRSMTAQNIIENISEAFKEIKCNENKDSTVEGRDTIL